MSKYTDAAYSQILGALFAIRNPVFASGPVR